MSEIPESAERRHLEPEDEGEWDDCENCGGKGYVESAESGARCTECMGDGKVPPPTREEIAEHKAEIDFDRMRDEGRI